MADKKTAAQLRTEQEERAKSAAHQQAEERKRAQEQAKANEEQAIKRFVTSIGSSWEKLVQFAANQSTTNRFVVVGSSIWNGAWPTELQHLMNEIAADDSGFWLDKPTSLLAARPLQRRHMPGVPTNLLVSGEEYEGTVHVEGGVEGWHPGGQVPALNSARGGGHHWLVVRWDQKPAGPR